MKPKPPACQKGAYTAWYRKERYLNGTRYVDSTGSKRRLHALMAVGWSVPRVALVTAYPVNRLQDTLRTDRPKIRREHAADIKRIYELMWDKAPPATKPSDLLVTAQLKGLARRRGWAAPMEWDEDAIDDPTAQPYRVRHLPRSRRHAAPDRRRDTQETYAEYVHLREGGVIHEMCAAKLGMTVGGLDKLLWKVQRTRQEAA